MSGRVWQQVGSGSGSRTHSRRLAQNFQLGRARCSLFENGDSWPLGVIPKARETTSCKTLSMELLRAFRLLPNGKWSSAASFSPSPPLPLCLFHPNASTDLVLDDIALLYLTSVAHMLFPFYLHLQSRSPVPPDWGWLRFGVEIDVWNCGGGGKKAAFFLIVRYLRIPGFLFKYISYFVIWMFTLSESILFILVSNWLASKFSFVS